MARMWHKRRTHHHPPDEEGLRRAADAVAESERALAETRQRASEVHDLGAALRRLRAENHFSTRIVLMLGESGGHRHERG